MSLERWRKKGMQQKRLLKDSRVPASARRFSLLALTLATLAATLGSTSLVQAEPVLNAPHSLEEYREKTLFSAFSSRSPKTLDPQRSYVSDEATYVSAIYETLYQYHYLKRPYEIIPRTAEAVVHPTYLDKEGKVLPEDAPPELIAESQYDIKIRPGIQFAPHPAFVMEKDASGKMVGKYWHLTEDEARGKRSPVDFSEKATRELTAADYVYGAKRLAKPRLVSPVLSILSEHVVGLEDYAAKLAELEKAEKAAGTAAPYFDLDRVPFDGVVALDKYTVRYRVKGKYPQFNHWLTMNFLAPMPVEADRFFSQPLLAANNFTLNTWPVGTGAFMMAKFLENRQHVLVKNPLFRGETYPCEGSPGDKEAGFLAPCGTPLPRVDKVIFDIEKEAVPLQSKFLQGYYDSPLIDRVDMGGGFAVAMGDSPEKAALYREKGLQLPKSVEAGIFYIGFNWKDPLLGGAGDKAAQERARYLRQAISIAVDWEEYVAIFEKDLGMVAHGIVPPGLFGYREDGPEAFNEVVFTKNAKGEVVRRSLDEAKALMEKAGYPGGIDQHTGKPLVLNFDYQSASQGSKSLLEWFQRQFAKLGIQLEIRATDFNRFQDKLSTGGVQIFLAGWQADYPDAENFLFLFYSPQGRVEFGGSNETNYTSKKFDRDFARMQYLDDTPEKQQLIDRMTKRLQEDAPLLFGYFPSNVAAYHAWIDSAKPSGMVKNHLQYLGVNAAERVEKIKAWNHPILWPLVLIALGLLALIWGAKGVLKRRDQVTLRATPEKRKED